VFLFFFIDIGPRVFSCSDGMPEIGTKKTEDFVYNEDMDKPFTFKPHNLSLRSPKTLIVSAFESFGLNEADTRVQKGGDTLSVNFEELATHHSSTCPVPILCK